MEIASGGSPAPNPTCGAGRQCVSTQTAARYWVQRHAAVIAEKTLTPNPLSMRAGSAFLHQLRREIASGGSPALNPVVRAGRKVCAPADPGANLGPASSLVHKAKELSSPSSGRQGKKQRRTRVISGPASSLVCPTGIEPAHIRSERIALSTELRTDKGVVIPPRTNFLKN